MKREIISASDEHKKNFPNRFRLKKEFCDNPQCQVAFEHATNFELYPDEVNYIGAIIEERDGNTHNRY